MHPVSPYLPECSCYDLHISFGSQRPDAGNKHSLQPPSGSVLSKCQSDLFSPHCTVSPEGINCIFMTAQAISKVLSAKISYYTVSAPIRISSLPGHDVPLDVMWLARIDLPGSSVVRAFVCQVHRWRRCGWFTLLSPVFRPDTKNQIHLKRNRFQVGAGRLPWN